MSSVKIRSYICHNESYRVEKMQEISKVSIDLFFCLIIGFIIIQASQSASQNQELTNNLTQESSRISADRWK
ncbi:MAG: hypothetical protein AAGE84_22045 [Cyanobacteria bacterium P01_G01_bin.39]